MTNRDARRLRQCVRAGAVGVAALVVAASLPVSAQRAPIANAPNLAGVYVLDRERSQFPAELGFGMDLLPVGGGGGSESEQQMGAGMPAGSLDARQTEDEAKNTRQLTAEVKSPPAWIAIEQSDAAVTISDSRGRSRTFHPTGREEFVKLDAAPVATTVRWEGPALVVRYRVSRGRELRCVYTRRPDARLAVDVQFVERGGRGVITRVYTALPPGAPPPPLEPAPPPATSSATSSGRAGTAPADVPADQRAGDAPLGPQKPDQELAGITHLGLVVEELSSQAVACGLDRASLESAAADRLTASGLKVSKNGDEDTYLYVNVMTAGMGASTCVSRYDVSVYTQTTARLSYQERPVLVLVSLLHQGGLAGGAPKEHAAQVLEKVAKHAAEFGSRIKAAGR